MLEQEYDDEKERERRALKRQQRKHREAFLVCACCRNCVDECVCVCVHECACMRACMHVWICNIASWCVKQCGFLVHHVSYDCLSVGQPISSHLEHVLYQLRILALQVLSDL